ncbi:hypothetical protein E2C01_086419 [Portunus trituberculatus]|uniref:Uncharacterized protein n=1 Tax=Portunus trituberculatus TaxID=210409 RepID=A0A5B7J9M4_PORTR|nr:hypothetical protein [Portunus trituberculatus]
MWQGGGEASRRRAEGVQAACSNTAVAIVLVSLRHERFSEAANTNNPGSVQGDSATAAHLPPLNLLLTRAGTALRCPASNMKQLLQMLNVFFALHDFSFVRYESIPGRHEFHHRY